jgi:competence protein ComEC
MLYRHLFPVVRLLLPFMAGIIAAVCQGTGADLPSPFFWSIPAVILILITVLKGRSGKLLNSWPYGLLLSIFLILSGYTLVFQHREIVRGNHFSHLPDTSLRIARVDEPFQEKEHCYKTILNVTAVLANGQLMPAEGHLLAYFPKEGMGNIPGEGSLLLFKAPAVEIPGPVNPGAFDYRRYMASANVYHQTYIKKGLWELLEPQQGFDIRILAHRLSNRFVSILEHNGLKGKEFAVASALILGQSDRLDSETLQAYSGTGAMHILSVSGLHVGVIFICISFLLGFIKRKGALFYLKTGIILLTIWAYALLTGLSPPVLRAAAMFTFITIGNASNRYVHIINSLAVSAFVLLMINPLMISNVGFQLSYIAIVGIVFLNEPIAGLWQPRNRVLDYIWSMIAVSLAAQLATGPLAMMVFHQFPVYFIPANLAAIPLSFLAIYAGLSVLLTSFIPWLSNLLGFLTNTILLVMNSIISFIEKLPGAVWHINSIFLPEMLLIYALILMLGIFILLKQKLALHISLATLLILSILLSTRETERLSQHKIIFYNSGKQTALGLANGKMQIVLADSAVFADSRSWKFRFGGTQQVFGLTDTRSIGIDTLGASNVNASGCRVFPAPGGMAVSFRNKRILVTDRMPVIIGHPEKIRIDYLLITKNPAFRMENLLRIYDPQKIIFDASNSSFRIKRWIKECKSAGIKSYSIAASGALVEDI